MFSGVVGTSARLEQETKRLDADILASCDILALAGQEGGSGAWDIAAETELRGRDGLLRLRGVRRGASARFAQDQRPG